MVIQSSACFSAMARRALKVSLPVEEGTTRAFIVFILYY